jgi:hypothetical protein
MAAFIATGSNNSATHFEYYLRNHPHVIRKNRNSVAIITGNESSEELKKLGADIFSYFGMGCRNVSKIYIPDDYNLDTFFSSIVDYGDVIHHHKYANNYNYYRSIYLLNVEKFLDNNFLLLKESKEEASPIGTLFYERYVHADALHQALGNKLETLQCIVCAYELPNALKDLRVGYGNTQCPNLWDYADGVDTLKFLLSV